MLNYVAPVNDSGRTLGQDRLSATEQFLVGNPPTASHEHRDAGRNSDDLVVVVWVIGGVGLDDVCAKFDCLANKGHDLAHVAIDAVTTGA